MLHPLLQWILCQTGEVKVGNAQDKGFLVQEQPVEMRQQDDVENSVYNCLVEIIHRKKQHSGHTIPTK